MKKLKLTKRLLFNYARFLFRSGEISYQKLGSWEFSENIDKYIFDTWQDFYNNQIILKYKEDKTND